MLAFDEVRHEYTEGGRVLPSVTQILKPLYGELASINPDVLEAKRTLGVNVHKAVELWVAGRAHELLTVREQQYFNQFLKWVDACDWDIIGSELRLSSALGYAGTVDMVAAHKKTGALAIIDLKCTAQLSPAVSLQTAGYAQAYAESRGMQANAIQRYSLRLAPTAFYFEPHSDPSDFAVFLAFLKVHQWSTKHNKIIKL